MSTLPNAAVLLYVEDDFLTQDVIVTALKEAGFEVDIASNGEEALAKLSNGADFRGLITDINLGKGPNGWDVAREARSRQNSLPVVYVSGDSDKEWSEKGVPLSVMIAKPFAPAQVVVAVSSLLVKADTQI
ncbi:MAG: response regulator [Hyphomicrobiales bacterium]|nr:response regulator [Hyphomicrobiales bacterium]